MKDQKRQIKQIDTIQDAGEGNTYLYALCDDGAIFKRVVKYGHKKDTSGSFWERVDSEQTPIPQPGQE